MSVTSIAPAGSASAQGDVWGVCSRLCRGKSPLFLPLIRACWRAPEVAKAGAILDVGCGAGLAAQVFSKTIGHVAGVDATAPFIEIARRVCSAGDFRVAEMKPLPYEDNFIRHRDRLPYNSFQYAASPVNALREARRASSGPKASSSSRSGVFCTKFRRRGRWQRKKRQGSLMPHRRPALRPFALLTKLPSNRSAERSWPETRRGRRRLMSLGSIPIWTPRSEACCPRTGRARDPTSSFERARDAVAAAIESYRNGVRVFPEQHVPVPDRPAVKRLSAPAADATRTVFLDDHR